MDNYYFNKRLRYIPSLELSTFVHKCIISIALLYSHLIIAIIITVIRISDDWQNQISTDLICRVSLDRRALSRLSHHPRSFPMVKRDSFNSFFLFSNFARQRARLCKSICERREEKSVARRGTTSGE